MITAPILALDPGCLETQYLVLNANGQSVFTHGHLPNEQVLDQMIPILLTGVRVCIEGVQGMGMIVGQEVFDTARWVGRFEQRCRERNVTPTIIYRLKVKHHMCGTHRAKDPNIRQALIDRFGGKEAAIGKKATPGPLYGLKSHAWSALALAITFRETCQ